MCATMKTYPKVTLNPSKRVYVSFVHQGKRHRLFNGSSIGLNFYPNSFPIEERIHQGKILAASVFSHFSRGGDFVLEERKESKSDAYYLNKAMDIKRSGGYSDNYIRTQEYAFEKLMSCLSGSEISEDKLIALFSSVKNNTTHNSLRKHMLAITNKAKELGMEKSPLHIFTTKKAKEHLHQPIDNLEEVFSALKNHNKNLYLCCLMTYGCLLRPHREIRELTWGDFTNNLSYINLSGCRNKSGRNRIVPVPSYVKEELSPGETNHNIFSGKNEPHNGDYFKTLWSRYKKQSDLIEEGQTLYSFRHSGAIDIFKRTGSLSKLQKAMGHSSLNVSLTYLRGLEIAELTEEDMPVV